VAKSKTAGRKPSPPIKTKSKAKPKSQRPAKTKPQAVSPPASQPTPVVAPPVPIPRELIGQRAYEIWERKMRLANDSLGNWLEAEAELRAAAVKPAM